MILKNLYVEDNGYDRPAICPFHFPGECHVACPLIAEDKRNEYYCSLAETDFTKATRMHIYGREEK